MTSQRKNEQIIKIAVVGDIHDQWEADDAIALQQLGIDLVLFVGDFGNESVNVVRAIAAVDLPKACVFGNHDAWYSASDWGKQKCPYDRTKEDWVQDQIDLLAETHVGYGKLDFPALDLTVIGSRPFSWGGNVWKNAEFYKERFGVTSFAESAAKMIAATKSAACETVIFLGHNGPVGLGDRPEDPCGKDWQPIGGDYGDPDLAEAIASARSFGKTIPLVTFGHMHHSLRHTKQYLRKAIFASDGTVYLNAARVPRIIQNNQERWRNFSIVSLQAGLVSQVSLVWVGQDFAVVSEEIIYQSANQVVQPA
ncbi:TIGR04168 family protein [Aliterella atlantica]|uniref:Metallophosphoesterase n=1 Tax=Aliterella atlantica CENA595 TaxID=1618023 RepID=A0A0D8ZT80_9CYAN|nr:TIGR04168 family protein [Aliterella atlantica]KJH71973.1 metallophosphoesterase [Aliterella atlantica CENA595]